MNKGEERKVKNRNVGDKCIKRVNTEEETGIYFPRSHYFPFSLNGDLKNLYGESVFKRNITYMFVDSEISLPEQRRTEPCTTQSVCLASYFRIQEAVSL